MSQTKKYVFLSLLTAAMLVLGYFENFIPLPFAIPGVKLGLANIFVVALLVFFRFSEGLLAITVRHLLSLLLFGNMLSFLLSISGGLASFLAMYLALLLGKDRFSLTGISILGSLVHVFAQMAAAALLTRNPSVFYYTPILLVSSLLAGIFVGLCSSYFVRFVQKQDLLPPKP